MAQRVALGVTLDAEFREGFSEEMIFALRTEEGRMGTKNSIPGRGNGMCKG